MSDETACGRKWSLSHESWPRTITRGGHTCETSQEHEGRHSCRCGSTFAAGEHDDGGEPAMVPARPRPSAGSAVAAEAIGPERIEAL